MPGTLFLDNKQKLTQERFYIYLRYLWLIIIRTMLL